MNILRSVFLCAILVANSAVQATFDSTIPVIDMKDFHSKSRHKIFVRDLADAMKKVGFVAVVNAGVDIETLDVAYKSAEEFYAKPLNFKMTANAPHLHGQRGYVQSESAKGQTVKDYKEFYHIAREYPDSTRTKYGYIGNVWPNDDKFRTAMQKMFLALDQHAVYIEQALSEGMGENKNFLSNMTAEGDSLLRAIHYPANPPANSLWAAEHTDIDLFTILPRSTAEGLQVQNSQGQWIDVVVPPDAFIINAGDMLQNLTNGVYKSSRHRVVSKGKNQDRYSMVLFVHPRPNDKMDPLPKFIAQVGEKKFANATRQELLSERLADLGLSGPDMLQQLAASGLMERLIAVKRASPDAMRALRDANLASPQVLAALKESNL